VQAHLIATEADSRTELERAARELEVRVSPQPVLLIRTFAELPIHARRAFFNADMRHDTADYGPARSTLLTIEDVASYLNCSRRTVERLVAGGYLRPLRAGARRRFRIEEVDAYTEGRSP